MFQKSIKIVILVAISTVSNATAQTVLKLGGNQYTINEKAALEVESNTKGFLPPRMTKAQRNLITSPPAGLQVWCTDCNSSTEPASGQLCIYLGSGWAPLRMNTTALVTTSKKADATNKPARTNATTAKISGVLVELNGAVPTETGIVYKPITGTDFTTLPSLNSTTGIATSPMLKKITSPVVTNEGGIFSVSLSSLGATPYYYRAYAKSDLGIGYGNPVIFNCANPTFSIPVVTDGTTLYPKFTGTMTVNAGTPKGSITEYGYYTGTTPSPTTNKVVLSTPASIAALDAVLDSETFTANPIINLAANDYYVSIAGKKYFRFYVIANVATSYSSDATFTTSTATVAARVTLNTSNTTNITNTSFSITGNITSTGTTNITENGFCWSTTNTSPAITDSKTTTTISPSFTATIDKLNSNTTYYVRSYAINNNVLNYGNTISVKTKNNLNAVELLMTNNQFNTLFPYRADLTLSQNGPEFYSYQSLVDAVNELKNIKIEVIKRQNSDLSYIDYTYKLKRTDLRTNATTELIIGSDYNESWNLSKAEVVVSSIDLSNFLNSGNTTNDKNELCGFLANISHETTGGDIAENTKSYGLYFKEEVGCSNGCPQYTTVSTDYPATPGKSYHGRGPIQLSWNYNYGLSSFLIYGDKNILLTTPESVLDSGKNAFMTAIIFWNMPEGAKPSAHNIINTVRGFAKTINIINGGVECGAANIAKDPQVSDRIGFYKKFAGYFGINITDSDLELSCRDLSPY